MKQNTTAKTKKSNNMASIRISFATKDCYDKKLALINKDEYSGKVNHDKLITYCLDLLSDEDIKKLQLSNVTWKHEAKRLKKIWIKKRGKISDDRWNELVFTGELVDFIAEHSRLSLENTPLSSLVKK